MTEPASAPKGDTPKTAGNGPIVDQDMQRKITAEELLRCQIKEGFEKGKRWSGRWWFWHLNKPFIIFFCSAIVLSFAGNLYQQYAANQRKEEETRERRHKLAVELAYRTKKAGSVDPVNARAYLNGRQGASVIPELQDRSLTSLLFELGYAVPGDAREKLQRLSDRWEIASSANMPDKRDMDGICSEISAIIMPYLR
jgi:hypothetical protein